MNRLNKLLTKFISVLLITNLLFARGSLFVSQVYGQSDPAPTTAPAPTTPPAPTIPPSDPKPSSELRPTVSLQPTSSPVPTSPPAAKNAPLPTTSPNPTTSSTVWVPTIYPQMNADSSYSPTPAEMSLNGQNSLSSAYSDSINNQVLGSGSEGIGNASINDPANIGTGPLSENFVSEINEKIQETLNKNLAQLQNKINEISKTGFNYANFNTLSGEVFTGNTATTLNLLNKLNSNISGIGGFSVYNIYGTFLDDIVFKFNEASNQVTGSFDNASALVAKNAVTGQGSTNVADASDSFKVKEANGNDATIVNEIVLESITGGNSASFNTGDGTIKTGNAFVSGNIVNLANTNLNVSQWLLGVVNIFGTLIGDIILPQENTIAESNTGGGVLVENSNTGPGSINIVSFESKELVSFESTSSAGIVSNVDVSANTGGNNASVNTGGGSVTTGSASASVSNSTVANTNAVNEEGTIWMVIVNEAGKWVGHIIGQPWGTTAASNSLPVFQEYGSSGSQTYSTLVQNGATGPMSENSASYSNTQESLITFENIASIENNISAVADTGNNEASYNTGKGSISTGNADASLNLVNMVNTNVTAKKFVAILVNVLGTFLGDVVTPEQGLNQQNKNSNPQPTSTILVNYSSITPIPSNGQTIDDSSTTSGNFVGGKEEVISYFEYGDYSLSYVSNTLAKELSPTPTKPVYQVQPKVAQSRSVIGSRSNIYKVINISDQTNKNIVKRGVFLSPAFAKATETSLPGILLGGARIKVNNSWLWILPVTVFIFALRRRKKVNWTSYINNLLEVIL